MKRRFFKRYVEVLCIFISVLISMCTSTFQGNLIEAQNEINEEAYASSLVSLGAQGECVVFRLPFAGGLDKALKVTLSVEGYRSSVPNVKYLAIAAPNYCTLERNSFLNRTNTKHNTNHTQTHSRTNL